MDDILSSLSINKTGEQKGDKYVVTISSYDEFSNIYNKLEKSLSISKDSDESYMNESRAKIIYLGDDFDLELLGDFNDDYYELNITGYEEREDN